MSTTRENQIPTCPHCGRRLRAFALPDNTGWEGNFQWACFNNECDYYRRGWSWMFERFGVRSSYRYRLDPTTGRDSPLAVWSEDALLDRILESDPTTEPSRSEAPATGAPPGKN